MTAARTVLRLPPRRRAPRGLADALAGLQQRLAPLTTLACVQSIWTQVAGAALSAEARPTAERDGRLTLSCSAAVWAQELQLLGPELVQRINTTLGREAVQEVRCVVRS